MLTLSLWCVTNVHASRRDVKKITANASDWESLAAQNANANLAATKKNYLLIESSSFKLNANV
jgi:hypothetical protein